MFRFSLFPSTPHSLSSQQHDNASGNGVLAQGVSLVGPVLFALLLKATFRHRGYDCGSV